MKPTITKEQAKELEAYRRSGDLDIHILEAACDEVIGGKLAKLDILTLAAALVNGYEVKKTPEEKLREYYESLWSDYCDSDDPFIEVACESARAAVKETLNLLGIKIEGVND
ncbi:hypothetical protein BUN12_0062 [Bacillus amyloliquefaciens]|jgi:hypothetical protein|uniref:Uncharacterized protein n=1 Tax=Bacillus amyloliquefaciens (strain ATCC 23350 / DSM 7 / BCRC 11601 / CCUG 28519 / NBRC 15535 / NRRL B-14393 / F) TaxID=692420 RepID=A0A9P1JFK9_BACAS|nr:hypothetical protein [Bacillus amyloliquefaciens]AZV88326.1 hypothetical protein BUN12_0062 [Bacillus amyloliquefaciens]MDR4375175.1 hypothetical protein [Bacillus amyloliquefaciens]MEC1838051.1 hypothetical protein [Bacillus amyloliquefaciens]MEC1846827.1 hypothetical protein [Bacillus amyloliquefaciens]MEC1930520.1 hypothetical protein [Bacillus amyloliquefaciens]